MVAGTHGSERLFEVCESVTPPLDVQHVSLVVINNLDRVLRAVDAERSRQELRGLLAQFKVEANEREVRVYNEQGRVEAALLRAVGADARNYGSGGRI